MINTVNSNYNNSAFRDFSKSRNENFFMQKPSLSEVPETRPVEKKKKRKGSIIMACSSLALTVGVGLFVLTRGLPKNFTKYLEKIKEFIEQKIEKSALTDSDKLESVYVYSLRKVNSFIKKAQSCNNFTSLKDILFKKLMNKTKPTSALHDNITNFFERVARQTVKSSYKSTSKKFDRMFNAFKSLDERLLRTNPDEIITINGKSLTKREWLSIAQVHRTNIEESVTEFLSEPQQLSRYRQIKSITSKLYQQFWDESFKDFWSKNNKFRRKEMWQTFIPEEKISSGKSSLTEQVSVIRNRITYTNGDRINLMEEQLKKLADLVLASDTEGLNLVKKLRWFLKNPDGLSENTEVFKRELAKLANRPLQEGLDQSILTHQHSLRETYVKSITDLLDSKNCGELQEMLSIYEKIAPYELSAIRPQVVKAVKSFDKSLKTETVDFFDKARDLALGSAPTDLISPITSAGLIAWGLANADNADERKSVVLKVGIPIIGGLAVSTLCTTRLIAGGKAMVFGAGSGLILNQIGNIVDKIRKNHSKNPTNSEVVLK